MHIEGINAQIISRQVDALKNFSQRQVSAVSEEDHFIRALLHLALDEAQKMLLIHTRGVVDMGVDLSNVVEVSMRHLLAISHFLVLIQQGMELEFALQIAKALKRKTLCGTISGHIQHGVKVHIKIS
jgi:hypothetical protein